MDQVISFDKVNEQQDGQKVSWRIVDNNEQIGTLCIYLHPTTNIDAPYVECSFVKPQNDDVLKSSLKHVIKYAYCSISAEFLYARYKTSDKIVDVYKLLDFEKDEEPYQDENGETWQNIRLSM